MTPNEKDIKQEEEEEVEKSILQILKSSYKFHIELVSACKVSSIHGIKDLNPLEDEKLKTKHR